MPSIKAGVRKAGEQIGEQLEADLQQQLDTTARNGAGMTSTSSNRHFQFGQQSPRSNTFGQQTYPAQPSKPQKQSNFHSNDSSVLQQRLLELESELAGLDQEYERLTLENEDLKHQHEEVKGKNRQLFEQLTHSHQEGFLMEDSIQQ